MKATPKTDEIVSILRIVAAIFDYLPLPDEDIKKGGKYVDLIIEHLSSGVEWRLGTLNTCTINMRDVRQEFWELSPDLESLPKYAAVLGTRFKTANIPANIEELTNPNNEVYRRLWELNLSSEVSGLTEIATQCWLWVDSVKSLIAEFKQMSKNPEGEQEDPSKQTVQEGRNKPQSKPPKPKRKGRPVKTLKDRMINDANGEKWQKIHDIWGESKGKDAALIIKACIKLGWMNKPTYTQVKDEFGDIGCASGYNRYLNSEMLTDDEIEGIMNILNQV